MLFLEIKIFRMLLMVSIQNSATFASVLQEKFGANLYWINA